MSGRYEVSEVKIAARGRWPEILSAAGIPRDSLDGRHHPCPRCGGADRFRLLDSHAGAVICNSCFAKGNGDGLAALRWLRDCSFPESLAFVAECCGLAPAANGKSSGDILERVAAEKRVTPAALTAYGAKANDGFIVVPMFGADGSQCSSFTIRAGGDKGRCAKGKPAGLFLPVEGGKARLPQAGETWHVVEGCKDAAALWALGYLAMGLPTCRLSSKFVPLLRGVDVVFIPDRDTAGDDGAQQSARKLFRVASTIKIAVLPAELQPSGGADVRDILAMEGGEQLVRAAIESAQPWQPERPADCPLKPEIKIGHDEHRMTAEAIGHLAARGDVFQRGGMLVQVRENPPAPPGIVRPEGGIRAVRIPRPRLREVISSTVEFVKLKQTEDGDEWVAAHVPQPVVDQIDCRGEWPDMPSLEGVVTSPQFLADGSILAAPGYDRHSGLYFAADCEFPAIVERPSQEQAKAAAAELLEVVADFPVDDVGRSAWLSIVLTVAARHAIDGPTPLFALDANVRGSGKSKLADAVGVIHSGRELPRSTVGGDDAETRKMITSTLLAGESQVLIDNVAGVLGCPALDALLTSSTWTDRILGQSAMTAAIPARAVWLATGNNLQFGADTARRTLRIRLESPLENPEERTGFRHPNLLGWVRQERGRLAAAAVTILRAWHCAGQPDMGLTPWGSFEGWSRLIRNPLVWLGLPDPGATRQEVQRESDREAMLLRQLIDAWEQADPERHGLTVVDALALAEKGEEQAMACAIAELSGPGGKATSRGIGKRISQLRGRVCGGRYFDRRDTNRGAIWVIRQSTETTKTYSRDFRDFSDSVSSPSRVSLDSPLISPIIGSTQECKNQGERAGGTVTKVSTVTHPPGCNHFDPTSWRRADGVATCSGCGKFMGRVPA